MSSSSSPQTASPPSVRDRIKCFRRVRASELQRNPKNWRTHPPAQRAALAGILGEVGYADACLARETDEGDLILIDGHLRADDAEPNALLPVLILDVNEAEADKLLAVMDSLSAMAETDASQLRDLLATVETDSSALAHMLEDLQREAGLHQSGDIDLEYDPTPDGFADGVAFDGNAKMLAVLSITQDHANSDAFKTDLQAFCDRHGMTYRIRRQ